jgi:hypothetical protein
MKNVMKQKVLALVAILIGVAFAPAASALPVFARQTGLSCNQCHFQQFPMLNAFGRSFKNSGFTMIGKQDKVEGDGLSIPANLNLGVLTTAGVENVSNSDTVPTTTTIPTHENTVHDSVNTPAGGGELSIFYGGRVTANIGFLAELGTAGPAESSSAKLPIFYEVTEGTRAGVVFLTTDGQGAAHSFETLNTGAVAVQRMVPMPGVNANDAHIRVNSAAQYLGTATGAQGASFVVNNDHYFINVGKYAVINALGAHTRGGSMGMTYARAAGMFDVAGFDSAVGVQMFRGDDAGMPDPATGISTATKMATEATIVDGQMQGKVGSMPLGVYLSYGTAPAVNDANIVGNKFNSGGAVTARSTNLAAQLGVVPGVATLMAAVRMGKNGAVDTTTGDELTDNAVMVGATYNMAVNVEASLSYTAQSGTAWDAANSSTGVEPPGKTVTTLMLQAMF